MKGQYILHRRLWWWPPQGVTDWWLPRTWLGGDEWCNIPLCINLPPFGAFIIYGQLRPLRTFPCRECWYEFYAHQPLQAADYLPGGECYKGGPIPYIEQWHIDDALAKLTEDKERYQGYIDRPLDKENTTREEDAAYNKGIIAAMELCELYIKGIAERVPPTPPRLQDELLQATREARRNVGNLIMDAGQWLVRLGEDW